MLTVTALLATTPAAHADAVREYADRRLVCWAQTRYTSTTTFDDDGTASTSGGSHVEWGVRDASGRAVPTTTFAHMVGDESILPELEAQARRTRSLGLGLLAGGAAGAGTGLALGAVPVDPQANNAGLFTTRAALVGLGLGAAAYGGWFVLRADDPLEHVPVAYDRGLAAQRCEQYNERLRQELGLTAEQTRAIDLAWTHAPERHPLVIKPAATVASVGLTGTF